MADRGKRAVKKQFDGYYYKHQTKDHTLCLIAGKAYGGPFIQVITKSQSFCVPFGKNNRFSPDGVHLEIESDAFTLTGEIAYRNLSPIRYDIMGPFRYFPMECRHGIISMSHQLSGGVIFNGQEMDFTGGKGYMEKDSGTSFPKSYVWAQANAFDEPCSVMVSVADIPFFGFRFDGCICVVHYKGKEYRLATYLGVRVECCTQRKIILSQRQYRLVLSIDADRGHPLAAPARGEMTRTILENPACPMQVQFFEHGRLVFDLSTNQGSFEYEAPK